MCVCGGGVHQGFVGKALTKKKGRIFVFHAPQNDVFFSATSHKKDVILKSITNKYSLSQLSLLGSVRVLLGVRQGSVGSPPGVIGVQQGSVRGPSGVCRVFVGDSFEVRFGVRQVGQSVVVSG